ncbi:LysR family transcriptional regulator [Seohaeicola zhoushanensis]|uniref:LysR family transcriptional regulator n=1 Tax=Seohaeicola zhoushanensis TaxID=1569283 RepID=A0A8J3GYE4_9RHOB|nr:LysR family transcriptional regulator [Seohaeicola zhoushanensis]GHF57702.1 LysR family transcriptional regulator [Seohaeicola zhoushanensis]
MDNWDEVRTAYQVARKGTVSGAAEVLGVHHATVIRHIDALEARIGVKLFQRHARGYTPTEAGQDLLRVAQTTDDQFSQLVARLRGQGQEVGGDLVVTSLSALAPVLVPVLTDFQQLHPDLNVRYLTSGRLFRLEYGEAHVAIRAGSPPDQPDNVVQPFVRQKVSLFASEDYIARHGKPEGNEDLSGHRFVGPDDPDSRAPYYRWLKTAVAPEQVTFRITSEHSAREAVIAGAGLGFLTECEASRLPGLVRVLPSREEWTSPLWLVTHVDLHRTSKVQNFLTYLKERSREWP